MQLPAVEVDRGHTRVAAKRAGPPGEVRELELVVGASCCSAPSLGVEPDDYTRRSAGGRDTRRSGRRHCRAAEDDCQDADRERRGPPHEMVKPPAKPQIHDQSLEQPLMPQCAGMTLEHSDAPPTL